VGGDNTERPRDPVAWVTPAAIGGFIEAGASNLTAEILAALDTDTMCGKLDKLNRSGYDERHLFLHVRPSALSFPIFEVLVFGGDLPTDTPTLPAGLSQLWLTSGFKRGGIVRAIRWPRPGRAPTGRASFTVALIVGGG
jgi:hypothetical protein